MHVPGLELNINTDELWLAVGNNSPEEALSTGSVWNSSSLFTFELSIKNHDGHVSNVSYRVMCSLILLKIMSYNSNRRRKKFRDGFVKHVIDHSTPLVGFPSSSLTSDRERSYNALSLLSSFELKKVLLNPTISLSFICFYFSWIS